MRYVPDVSLPQTIADDVFVAPINGAWRAEGVQFDGEVYSDGVSLPAGLYAERAIFGAYTDFSTCHVGERLSLSRAVFMRGLEARGLRLDGEALARGARFLGDIWATESLFNGPVSFDNAHFLAEAGFGACRFSGPVSFRGAVFEGGTGFEDAIFAGPVDFSGCTFRGPVWFSRAQFHGPLHLDGVLSRHTAHLNDTTCASGEDGFRALQKAFSLVP